MTRQPVTHPRAARSLALRRRVCLLWSSFAVVALVGSGLWLSVGSSPVAAAALVGTYEGYSGTTGHGEGAGSFGPRVVLFEHVLTAGYSFRAVVKFSEDATLYGTNGFYTFWWECGGAAIGGSAGGELATGRQGLASVTVTAVGQSSTCLLIAQVNASTVFNSVIVQIYTGVTENPIPVTAPLPSLMPWTWPSATAGPYASSTPYPSATPTASLCVMPMASGMLGPPVLGTCGEPSPSPVASDAPDTIYTCGASWPQGECTVTVGEIAHGDVVHMTWLETTTTNTSQVEGSGLLFTDAYSQNGGGSWLPSAAGAYLVTDTACPMFQSWAMTGNVPDSHSCVSSAVWRNDRIGADRLVLRAHVGQFNGGEGAHAWTVTAHVWIVPEAEANASPSPSPSPSPLGECFYPLPVGQDGPLAPRPCASGEAPGHVSGGECLYRTPLGQFGPPAPRVCGPGELPGTYGTDGGGASNDTQPNCTESWVVGSTLPRCGGTPAPGMGGGYGDVDWPLSHYACLGGKPGYLAGVATSWTAFPGLTLDIGAYFEWIGSGLGWLVGVGQNALAYLWDVAADFVVPCPLTLGQSFSTFTDTFRSGPFGTVAGTSSSVAGALAGGAAVPFQSFHVLGATIAVPLGSIADAAAPVRPYLAPLVWLGIALRALWMIGAAVRAPGPTGPTGAGP